MVASVLAPVGKVTAELRVGDRGGARGRANSDGVAATGVKLRFTAAGRKRLRGLRKAKLRPVVKAAGHTARTGVALATGSSSF